jgi:hypothetical protein
MIGCVLSRTNRDEVQTTGTLYEIFWGEAKEVFLTEVKCMIAALAFNLMRQFDRFFITF